MARVNNRRRYIRHAELDGLKRGRLERIQDDFAVHGGAPKTVPRQQTVTFTNASNQVNAAAHGYSLGDGPFVFITDGLLPAELELGTLYWLAGTVNVGDFQVTDELGGAVVAFTDDGSGTHTLCEITEDPV